MMHYQSAKVSYQACAKGFGVNKDTLRRRLQGGVDAVRGSHKQQALLECEERALVRWIKKLSNWGFSPRVDMVVETAGWFKSQRGAFDKGSTIKQDASVSHNWFGRFKKRHPELITAYSRRMEASRASHNDPQHIQSFFDLYKEILKKYFIKPENIWNMDEKGYLIGISSSSKVVTVRRGRGVNRDVANPGNRELVTTSVRHKPN